MKLMTFKNCGARIYRDLDAALAREYVICGARRVASRFTYTRKDAHVIGTHEASATLARRVHQVRCGTTRIDETIPTA